MGSRTFTLVVVHVHGLHDALAIDAVILLLATHVLVIALPRTAIERQHGAGARGGEQLTSSNKKQSACLRRWLCVAGLKPTATFGKFFVKA